MSDAKFIGRDSVAQQTELFRLAEARFGLTIAKISDATGISVSTLKGWRGGAAMPAWALGALGDAGIPDHLLSLITLTNGKVIHSSGRLDLDDLAVECGEFTRMYAEARTPSSEAQIQLGHRETAALQEQAAKVRSAALGS